jgi:hypothetical protein
MVLSLFLSGLMQVRLDESGNVERVVCTGGWGHLARKDVDTTTINPCVGLNVGNVP